MLTVENLSVKAGSFRLGPVDMHVEKGEYRIVLGSSGTGKTVLFHTIAGLHDAASGSIELNGTDITDFAPENRNIGVVFQDYALFPHMTVEKNISFGLRMKGLKKREIKKRITETAAYLDILHILDRSTRNLSGGEKQRTALARALVMKPHLLLLDEPLSALDRLSRDRLQGELKRINRELGMTILHITHDTSEAFMLADRLSVMKKGEIAQEGTPEELMTHPESLLVAKLMGIRNFIPARVEKDQFYGEVVVFRGLGWQRMSSFSKGRTGPTERFLLTVPDWAVELGREENTAPCIWEGEAQIAKIEYRDGYVAAELVLPGANRLNLSLSHRETADNPNLLIEGAYIHCRILSNWVYWVPEEQPWEQ